MKVVELKREMDERFRELREEMNTRFAEVGTQFAEVGTQFAEVGTRFGDVDTRFDEVDTRFDEVDMRFDEVNARIDTAAADTRRHFDVVAESLKTSIATVAEGVAALSTQIAEIRSERIQIVSTLHDHEDRLHTLEQPRG